MVTVGSASLPTAMVNVGLRFARVHEEDCVATVGSRLERPYRMVALRPA
jgi:hypothetical protein